MPADPAPGSAKAGDNGSPGSPQNAGVPGNPGSGNLRPRGGRLKNSVKAEAIARFRKGENLHSIAQQLGIVDSSQIERWASATTGTPKPEPSPDERFKKALAGAGFDPVKEAGSLASPGSAIAQVDHGGVEGLVALGATAHSFTVGISAVCLGFDLTHPEIERLRQLTTGEKDALRLVAPPIVPHFSTWINALGRNSVWLGVGVLATMTSQRLLHLWRIARKLRQEKRSREPKAESRPASDGTSEEAEAEKPLQPSENLGTTSKEIFDPR